MSQSARENGWATYPADKWHEDKKKLLFFQFWKHCLDEFGGPVVDLCCGNGRYSIAIAEVGHKVVGVDVNKGFIEKAREWAKERAAQGHKADVSFVAADVVTADLAQEFRLAIMPGWSWQILLTQEDQIAFLKNVRKHLGPSGAFAFNVFIPFYRQQGLVRKDGKYEWPIDPNYHGGTPREYDPATQIETMRESNVHEIKVRHTSLAEFELLFKLTGFEISEMYGDDEDMRPFTYKPANDYTVIVRPT